MLTKSAKFPSKIARLYNIKNVKIIVKRRGIMKFYEKLVILRKKALLSQEALAEELDVTRQTVSKWELGQTKPDIDKLNAMSKLFNIDINILTNDELSLDGLKTAEIKDNKGEKKMEPEKKERKFILYIVIIILIASSVTLTYRVGCAIKNKYDDLKQSQNNIFNNIFDQITDSQSQFDIDDFNSDFELWDGSQTNTGAGYELDEVMTNNKKNSSHLIEVVFDGTSYGTDADNIKNIKSYLKVWTDDNHIQYYEVSLYYDDNGYVNKVTIETR